MGHVDIHSQDRDFPGNSLDDDHRSYPGNHVKMPIAVVGMSCRLPGGVGSPEDLWEMCARGGSGWSEIPKSRFSARSFQHPNHDRSGVLAPNGGHFLKGDVAEFDASFFHISEKEAKAMDPQQRIILECVYEALENAAISLRSISGRNVGVFTGGSYSDYNVQLLRDPETAPMFQATGCADAMMANRVSYLLNLQGPSFTVDTACSSSLTAIHLACQSIRSGETNLAIAGGCHLNLSPDHYITYSMSRLLSPEGKCHAFDHRAKSGYGTGEGAGFVILKPFDEAVRAGDSIRAVVCGSGINQDGRSLGITTPRLSAQEALIRSVYECYDLDPSQTAYVEAHGTGTKVGDPIEVGALRNVFSRHRSTDDPLYLGSVKSNVGHLEGASGVISFIKAVMMVESGFIPPHPDFESPNPEIPLAEWNMKANKKQIPWPANEKTQASVNNFGFGGGNAHVVLQAAPYLVPEQGPVFPVGSALRLIVLSANDKASLESQAQDLLAYLRQRPEFFYPCLMSSLALTLQRRSVLPWKVAIPVRLTVELMAKLGKDQLSPKRSNTEPRVAFVFTGQGAQWAGMGRELKTLYPVFADTLHAAEKSLRDLGATWSLSDELDQEQENSNINKAYISQPACTAIQIALVDLFSAWGIHPHAVTGHSSGEIAAAYAAGALTLDKCMKIAYHRGTCSVLLREKFPELKGSMLAVGCDSVDAEAMVSSEQNVNIACINSPSSVTISGDDSAINKIAALASERKLFNRKLQTDVAYHSHHMQLVEGDYRSRLGDLEPLPMFKNAVRFHSSLKGHRIPATDLTTSYWVANLVSPVLFQQAVEDMLGEQGESSIDTLIEIGPHAALQGPIRQITMGKPEFEKRSEYIPSLVRKQDSIESVMTLAAAMFVKGADIDLPEVNAPTGDSRLPKIINDLSPYPWKHTEKYWHESRLSSSYRLRQFPPNDVLGVPAADFNTLEPEWRNIVRLRDTPWLRYCRLNSEVVYPVSGYLSKAVEAAHQQALSLGLKVDGYQLRDICFKDPLVLKEDSDAETTLSLRPYNMGKAATDLWNEFCVYSYTDHEGWIERCRGFINAYVAKELPATALDFDSRGHRSLEEYLITSNLENGIVAVQDKAYEDVLPSGVEYGELFRNLSMMRKYGKRYAALLSPPDVRSTMPEQFENEINIHPVHLESCLQSTLFLLLRDVRHAHDSLAVSAISSLSIGDVTSLREHQPVNLFGGFSEGRAERPADLISVVAFDTRMPNNRPIIEIDGIEWTYMPPVPVERQKRVSPVVVSWSPYLPLLSAEKFRELCKDLGMKDRRHNGQSKRLCSDPESQQPSIMNHERQPSLCCCQTLDKDLQDEENMPQIIPAPCEKSLARVSRCLRFNGNNSIGRSNNLLELLYGEHLDQKTKGRCPIPGVNQYGAIEHSYEQAEVCIDILAHQNPQLSIFELCTQPQSVAKAILKVLGGGQTDRPARFSSYTIAVESESELQNAQKALDNWGDSIKYRTMKDAAELLNEHYVMPADYDIVLIRSEEAYSIDSSILKKARGLLRPGGHLFILDNLVDMYAGLCRSLDILEYPFNSTSIDKPNHPSVMQLKNLLQDNGSNHLNGYLRDYVDPYRSSDTIITAIDSPRSEAKSGFIIVCNPLHDCISIAKLKANLMTMGTGPVEIISLPDARDVDLSHKICIVLSELEGTWLTSVDPQQFSAVQKICGSAEGLLWITRGAYQNSNSPDAGFVLGLARAIRSETNLAFITLDIDAQQTMGSESLAGVVADLVNNTFCKAGTICETEFMERCGTVYIPRLTEERDFNEDAEVRQWAEEGKNTKLVSWELTGTPTSKFVQESISDSNLADDEVRIKVEAIGVNNRDTMAGNGLFQQDFIGSEASGSIVGIGAAVSGFRVGDRVCALPRGSYSTFATCSTSRVAKIPSSMSFQKAASTSMAFCTAYHSLIEIARLREGERVLVHAAAESIGQAAVTIAHRINAEVFVTITTGAEENLVNEKFGISRDHILSSKSATFGMDLQEKVGNRGVDIVLHHLDKNPLPFGWESCLAKFGRAVGVSEGGDGLAAQRPLVARTAANSTFTSVNMYELMEERPNIIKRLLEDVMDLFEKDSVQVISPVAAFPIQDIAKVFAMSQSEEILGKAIVVPEAEAQIMVQTRTEKVFTLQPDASYLICGGSGGLARSLARWFVQMGARNIILASRTGGSSSASKALIEQLEAEGSRVVAYRCDISQVDQVKMMISDLPQDMPPIRGVIHSAMVLCDKPFEQLSYQEYTEILAPKVSGAWALHHAFPDPSLSFFIFLSSMAGTYGSIGQAAYAGTSTFLSAFVQYRRSQGLPATALHLGPISEVGFMAEHEDRNVDVTYESQFLNEKEFLSYVQAAIEGRQMPPSANGEMLTSLNFESDTPLPYWASDPRFSHLIRNAQANGWGSTDNANLSSPDTTPVGEKLKSARSRLEASSIIYNSLASKFASVLMVPLEDISPSKPIVAYGLDSLVAIEIRNYIAADLGARLTLQEILTSGGLDALKQSVEERTTFLQQ